MTGHSVRNSVRLRYRRLLLDPQAPLRAGRDLVALEGYASLSYLQSYAFNRIKIDKSFTFGLPGNRLSTAIVSAATALASELGMASNAEGVETEDQLLAITRLGCSHAQGFHLGRPTPNPLAMLTAGHQKVVNAKA